MNNRDSGQASNFDDLVTWDFAEDFDAYEVAGLVCGKGNHHLLAWNEKQPILGRMEKAFNAAKRHSKTAFFDADISFEGDFSIKFPDRDALSLYSILNEEFRLEPDYFIASEVEDEGFEDARFGRDEIHRWLQAIGATSKYAFALPKQTTALAIKDDRPLGTRERNTLLTMIGLLCEGAGHDLSKAAKTAVAIKNAAALKGIDIGESTIEGHLKKAKEALEGKTK